jgi:hypothetical protein
LVFNKSKDLYSEKSVRYQKMQEEDIMSTASVLTKRRPGHPRKADSEATTASPVTPADSSEEIELETGTVTDAVTEAEPVTAPAKRRPGRPKGSKNKPKVTGPEASTTAPAKRRPGRPKGSKNKPKETAAATAAPAPATAETPVKRGPGRPRKNPATAETPVKRGPGRPRKNPEAATTGPAKRRPGRPKGSKNKPKVTGPEASTTAPAKRGPGRPKGSKNKPKETVATATATAPVAKRGPGRPRKDASAAPKVIEPTAIKTTGGVVRKVLVNPFKAGDSVLIPAGSIFTSSAPTAKGRQVVRRGHNVTVHDIIPARVQPRKSEKGSNVLVRPPRIRAKGSGGYWKDITLTDKIVRLNGKTPNYEAIAFSLKDEPVTV